MARGHGRILTSIWEDSDFLALDEREQRLYLFLISQPNLNHAGLLPLTLRRWSRKAAGLTEARFAERLESLHAVRAIEIDYEADELFISGYFQHVNIGGQPRLLTAALDAIADSPSPGLRGLASMELTQAVAAYPAPPAPRGVRAEVLRRDGWRCKGCGWRPGDDVPRTATGRALYRGLEIDHIYPQSRGGTSEVSNLQVLCTSCNTSKGARI